MEIRTIGIDLGKTVFHFVCVRIAVVGALLTSSKTPHEIMMELTIQTASRTVT